MRARLAFWVGAALVLAAGCSDSKGDSSDEEPVRISTRSVPRVTRDFSSISPLDRQTPQTEPAASYCPAGYGVDCDDRCCPDGASCLDFWGAKRCAFEATPASCDPGTKACVAPFSCGPEACLLPNAVVGSSVYVYMADPADLRPGRFGTALTGGLPAGSCATPSIYGTPTTLPAGGSPGTLEAWVRTVHRGRQAVLAYGTGTEVRGLELPEIDATATSSIVRFRLGAAACDAAGLGSPAGPALHDGAWHHLAATYDSGEAKVYVDGGLKASCPVAAPATPASATLLFGNAPREAASAPCFPLQGEIDEVRILALAASSAQIAADATGELTAIPETVGLWHLEKGTVNVVCCPEAGTCSTIGQCRAASTVDACPASHPIECADGSCCPEGASCDATSGCVVPPATRASCAEGLRECTDGSCCPTSLDCLGAGRCGKSLTGGPSQGACPAGSVDAYADGRHFCCPAAPGSEVRGVSFASAYSSCLPSGSTALCGTAPIGPDGCPAGYAFCGAAVPGACVAAGTETPCPNGGASCHGPLGAMEQCCPNATDACLGTTCCSAPGEQLCGSGCCPASTVCNLEAGRCEVAAQPRSCGPLSAPSCKGECCPEGSTCDPVAGCLAGGSTPRACPAGYSVVCGDACCADGARCEWGQCTLPITWGHCEAGHTACNGVSTTCCPAGQFCETPDVGTVCSVYAQVKQGARGIACGAGRCMGFEDVCVENAGCCASTTSACGQTCCRYECGEAGCLCPAGTVACGEVCCSGGEDCVEGQCVPACDPGQTVCGDYCCGEGLACVDGACVCGGELPQDCGDSCCGARTTCNADGPIEQRCLCPDTRPTCGGYCCLEEEVCQNDACVEKPEEPGGGEGIPCNGRMCTGTAICVSERSCVKGISCQCNGSSAGVCKDFVANGYAVSQCVTNAPSALLACCPGQIWINGRCQAACE